MSLRKLDEFMVKRGGSVDPSKFKNETFELLSIPAFDQGSPEILEGEKIGSAKKIVEPRDVLLSKIVPHIRRCWVVPERNDKRQIASGEWIQFRGDDFIPEYLRLFLVSNRFHSQFMKTVKGVGGSLLRASPAQVAEIEIPLPPLDDQKRIAHLLGKVEGLIAQRKQHLQQLDDLLKSVFLEMFGDPVRNEKEWEPGTSSFYAEMVTVGVVVKPASYYVESGVVALRSLNIKPNRIDLNDLAYFPQEANDGVLSKSRLQTDDVVIVRTGKTGTSAVVPAHLEGANCIDLIIVRPKRKKMHHQYLACLLNSERGMALVASREVGGIQKHFNVGALNKIPFPLPPIDLQNQFATIVEKVGTLKSRYQQSLTDLENLYGALSQKAFKNELDLSRVVLPAKGPEIAEEEKIDIEENLEAACLPSGPNQAGAALRRLGARGG